MINTCMTPYQPPEPTLLAQAQFPRSESMVEGEEVVAATTPAAETEIRYSWFYYEREDQFEDLFESLNLKGQRERKLQENLKKIKDRLKLKKPKRAAVRPEAQQVEPTEN